LEPCNGGLRKKYVREEETPFVKHAFLQQQDWDMFVQETNSPSFQQLGQVDGVFWYTKHVHYTLVWI
jgi:hypothetical protein